MTWTGRVLAGFAGLRVPEAQALLLELQTPFVTTKITWGHKRLMCRGCRAARAGGAGAAERAGRLRLHRPGRVHGPRGRAAAVEQAGGDTALHLFLFFSSPLNRLIGP